MKSQKNVFRRNEVADMQAAIPAVGYLGALVLYLIMGTPVMWDPAVGAGDGLEYLAQIRNFHERDLMEAVSIAAPRLLPILPALVGTHLGGPPAVSFRIFALIGFTAFAAGCFGFLRQRLADDWLAAGFTGLLLVHFWPIAYNLHNIYHLTDLFAYPLSLWMVWALAERRWPHFYAAAVLALLTKETLWLLVAPGILWHLCQKARAGGRGQAAAWRWPLIGLAGFGIAMATLIVVQGPAAVDLYRSCLPLRIFDGSLYQGRVAAILIHTLPVFLPFLAVLLLAPKQSLRAARRHPATAFFVSACLVIAFERCLKRPDQANFQSFARVGMPAAYLVNLYACLLLGRTVRRRGPAAGRVFLVASPLLFGTAHLFFLAPRIQPFLVLPSVARHIVFPLLFAGLMLWGRYREHAHANQIHFTQMRLGHFWVKKRGK